ncbi:Com family DNA-binding transcriptional regulator [Acinetobacter sp. ETR1]|uniref:Com family DNA-binding transcriptional regulator n=1 Tax=Acinetobacter sp. ETR1 TaxID=1485002 RepID=UPI0009D7535A
MQLINCRSCGRLLGKGIYTTLEIKCPRCKTINFLSISNAPLDCPERPYKVEKHGD